MIVDNTIVAGEYVLYNNIPFIVVGILPGNDFALIGLNYELKAIHNGRPVPVKDIKRTTQKIYKQFFNQK